MDLGKWENCMFIREDLCGNVPSGDVPHPPKQNQVVVLVRVHLAPSWEGDGFRSQVGGQERSAVQGSRVVTARD